MAGKAFAFYEYHPSIVAAIIFVVLFFATTAVHCFQTTKKRTFYFIPLIIGGFFEWIGYVGRALAHSNETSMSIYIMQTLLLLLGPSLFAATIYMTLGRIILFTRGEDMAPIRANWLTKIFVLGDVLSFLVQSGGGAMMANANSMDMGKKLVVIGLLLQILFFGVFIITGVVFHHRLHSSPTAASMQGNWERYLYALYATGILILIRSIFRIFEFSGGRNGVLMSKEVFLYIFDGVLMLGVMVIFNVIHPGEIIGRRGKGDIMMLNGNSESQVFSTRA